MDNRWRIFDLHYSNFQSIGKAQVVHLTTLVVYLSYLWGWYFLGAGDNTALPVINISVHGVGLWKVTPFFLTLVSLALVGSINAAGPARKKLDRATENLDLPEGEFEFYDLDTHKNVLDYYTFLTPLPWRNIEHKQRRFLFRHFLYSLPLAAGIFSSCFALYRVKDSEHFLTFAIGVAFVCMQVVYSLRTFWNAFNRFFRSTSD